MERVVEDGDVRPGGIQDAQLMEAAGAMNMRQQVAVWLNGQLDCDP
jgi:hypothetical protein